MIGPAHPLTPLGVLHQTGHREGGAVVPEQAIRAEHRRHVDVEIPVPVVVRPGDPRTHVLGKL